MRRKYLIDKNFQVRFIVRIMSMLAIAVFCGAFLTYSFMKTKKWSSIKASYSAVTAKAGGISGTEVTDIVLPALLLFGFGFLILSSLFILIYSNKIAGPLWRMENEIKKMAEGDMGEDVKLRTGDEFMGLAASINHLKKSLRGKNYGVKRDFS